MSSPSRLRSRLVQLQRGIDLRGRLAARLERRRGVACAEAIGLLRDTLFFDGRATILANQATRRLLRRVGFRRVLTEELTLLVI